MKTTLASFFAITALFIAGCGAPETGNASGRAAQGLSQTGKFPTGGGGLGSPGICAMDSDCGPGNFCNDVTLVPFACTAQAANGAAVPTGTCTPALGARECTSGVCDIDNKCGIANGDASCTSTNAATVCRSTFCSTNGTCKPTATGCNVDGDCSPMTEFCNTSTNVCTAKAANGVPIPANAVCTGATATTAGTSNGCTSGTCGADNVCGEPNETGGCTSSNATTVCRSGVCDPAGNGGAGICHQCTATSSAACTGATPICDSTFVCAACNADNGTSASSGGTAACGAAAPYCPGGGAACTTCGTAGATTTCTAGGAVHSGGICQSSGACGNSCTQDSSCAAQQFCNTMTSACTADLANGTLIPTISGHTPTLDGTCTPAVGNAVCATHVCDTTDKKCGFANGDGSCTTTSATVCRSGTCSANGSCVAVGGCNVDADCSTAQFCNTMTNACAAKAVTTAPVPAAAGVCPAGGTSKGCLSGTCDATSNTCGYKNDAGPCTTANAGGTSGTCQSGVCDPAKNGGLGFCEQCTTANTAACSGTTPICDTTADTCVACNGDRGAGSTAACPGAANPYCPGNGGACSTCGTVGATMTCTATGATHAGMTCQVNGACANACATDANCTAGSQYCDNSAVPSASQCVADIPNGGAIPVNPLHNPALVAMCTPAVGAAVCAAGVCDTDDLCGYKTGSGPCTTLTASKVCRSGLCSTNGTCKATSTSCNADGDCSTNQFCNTATHACVGKVANGVPIPANATCVGATSTAAGTSKGCTTNTCGTDNICGTPNGAGGCTVSNATTACRSGICDITLNGGAGFCEQCTKTNQACTGGTVCNTSTDTCTACNGDNSTTATATCSTASPYCPGGGAACTSCGTVGGTTTCTAAGATHAGTTCVGSGACSTGCTTDANCIAGTQFCNTGATPVATCTADLANGTPLPTIAGHTPTLNGLCNSQVGNAVCASHVCDTNDNACGYSNGHGTCTPSTSTTVCRSGECSTNGTCVRSGGCNVDGDCTTAEWCDTDTSTCEARAATGMTIPSGGTCNAGVSDRCLSGSCDSDNICGHASGKGPCGVATESGAGGDCRTQLCDGTASLCAQCTTADTSICPSGTTCSSDVCVLPTPAITEPANGSTLPAGVTTILGTGTPGSTITVRVDGTVVGTVTVDNNGFWALPMPTTIDGGTHTITAVATAGSGISSVTSATATSTVTVTGENGDMKQPGDMGNSPDMAGPQTGRPGVSGGGLGCSMTTQPVNLQLGAALLVLAMLVGGLLRRRALRS